MKKKSRHAWALLVVFMMLTFLFPGTARGSTAVSILLNGKPIESDVEAYIDENSRTMVPARFIAEALGGEVAWDAASRKVEIARGVLGVELYIDENIARVDGKDVEMDTVAVIHQERTMVPLRFLAETFGMDVDWIAETGTVTLTKVISPDEIRNGLVKVTGTAVNIRPGPGTDYEPVISKVFQGDELFITGQTGDWYQVTRLAEHDKPMGWVASWLVELQETVPAPEAPLPGEKETTDDEEKEARPIPVLPGDLAGLSSNRSALVMKASVNLRASSSLESPVIGRVSSGDWLEIIDDRDGWYQIRLADGETGWVAAWLVATRYEPPGKDNYPVPQRNNPGPMIASWTEKAAPENPNEGDYPEGIPENLPLLTDIEVFQGEKEITIRVKANGALSLPHALRLTDPYRMAFDFHGILAGERDNSFAPLQIHTYPVMQVRAGQFEQETVRVVADLKDNIVHSVARLDDENTVEIVLKPVFPMEKTVVIDPGHGTRTNWSSTDPGAIGPTGIAERDVVTNISRKLGEILLSQGYAVIFTRQEDTGLTLEERAGVANQTGGVFVSVHANAHPDRSTAGTMTFYPGTRGGGSEELLSTSKLLAELVQRELLSHLKRPDKGVRQANFAVLRNAHPPAILVEIAFLSNPEEEKLLAQEDFQNRAALAMAQGIQKYMERLQDGSR